jgi:DNA replication protein DnaC
LHYRPSTIFRDEELKRGKLPPPALAWPAWCTRESLEYQLLILDDIAYVTKDQAETSVLFELIAARYEHRSLLITANHPFGEWGKIFSDQAMTLAAIDRLVHHATILAMNVESYRRKAALKRKRGPGD